MEIRLEIPGNSGRELTLTLTYELDQMSAAHLSETPRLGMSAQIQRVSGWDKQDGVYPIITALHGVLTSSTSNDMLGAHLLPVEALPLALSTRESQGRLSLAFALSDRFVHFLEEQRVDKQNSRDMQLALRFWGTIALAAPQAPEQSSPAALFQWEQPSTIVGLRQFSSGTNATTLRISHSDWLDRFLPGLGYGRSVLIELPLTRTPPIPEPYKQAVTSLDAARAAFQHEDYRAVLKYGREVLEYLGKLAPDEKLTTFCHEQLEPVVGETKSQAIDRALNALRELANASSHANPFRADRAIAAYVVETLAIQLRYISAVVSM